MGPSNSGSGTKQPRINSLQIQSSAYSLPIPLGWGRARVGLNLMYAVGFYSQEVKRQSGGGKGGGSQEQITYKYFMTTLLMGICNTATGPIRAINAVYRDQSVFAGIATPEAGAPDVIVGPCLENAGIASAHAGYSGQGPYYGLTNTTALGYDANAVLGYDTTAYLNASNYQLNSQGGLQNHSVEVDFALSAGNGLVDANPGDIIPDFLANCVPQWLPSTIGDLSGYRTYCLAAGLLLSPLLDTQSQASSFVDEVMNETNSQCWIRGDGTLQVRPLADAAIAGNGVTYTPDLTPIYDLDENDFIVDNPGDDPIRIDTEKLDDLYNVVQVQFKNRQHQYNDETVTANDQASVDEFGQRKRDPDSFPNIKDPTVARLVAQLWLQRYANYARPFTFMLPFGVFDRLEEMDLVTVSNEAMGLERVLVRIQEIDEDEDSGKLTIKALEVLVGTANAPVYESQSAGGTITDFESDPGDVATPVLFLLPTTITNGQLVAAAAVGSTNPNWGGAQVWVSLTDDSYKLVGTISGGARYGVTTADLPIGGTTVPVDLSISGGQLSPGSATDAASFVTLCWLGGELIAYQDATLSGPNTYALGELQRGGYQTPVIDHPIGTSFVRMDNSVFQYPFQSAQIGQTLHIKFLSFNIFEKQLQPLESVEEYTLAQPRTKRNGEPIDQALKLYSALKFRPLGFVVQEQRRFPRAPQPPSDMLGPIVQWRFAADDLFQREIEPVHVALKTPVGSKSSTRISSDVDHLLGRRRVA